jgi:hypothetical protein
VASTSSKAEGAKLGFVSNDGSLWVSSYSIPIRYSQADLMFISVNIWFSLCCAYGVLMFQKIQVWTFGRQKRVPVKFVIFR